MKLQEEISQWLSKNEVTLEGKVAPPRPVFDFAEAGFPPEILTKLCNSGFEKPTVIQSISWPVALSGRDMISIARTGSGKTLAVKIMLFFNFYVCNFSKHIKSTEAGIKHWTTNAKKVSLACNSEEYSEDK